MPRKKPTWSHLTLAELQQECIRYNLSPGGTKQELIQRLKSYFKHGKAYKKPIRYRQEGEQEYQRSRQVQTQLDIFQKEGIEWMKKNYKIIGEGTYGIVFQLPGSTRIVKIDKVKGTGRLMSTSLAECCSLSLLHPYADDLSLVHTDSITYLPIYASDICEQKGEKICSFPFFIFMEDEGTSLYDRKPANIKEILFQLLRTLAWFETNGFVHGDVSIKNILYDAKHAHSALIDFGSFVFEPSILPSMWSTTPNYRPPEAERVGNREKLRPNYDVFSLGIIGLNLCGIDWDDTHQEINIAQHRNTELEFKVPDPVLEHLLHQMLLLSPEQRPSASQLLSHPYFSVFTVEEHMIPPPLSFSSYVLPKGFMTSKHPDTYHIGFRKILLEWMMELCVSMGKDQAGPPTTTCFSLAVSILDRYYYHTTTPLDKITLQCVGACCLLLALALLQQIDIEFDIVVHYTSKEDPITHIFIPTYTHEQVRDTVNDILTTLRYQLYMKMFDRLIPVRVPNDILMEIVLDHDFMCEKQDDIAQKVLLKIKSQPSR